MDSPDGRPDAVCTIVDEVRFEVERGKIAEFVRATAVTDPVHRDPSAAGAAGLDDIAATATHVVVAGHHRDPSAFIALLGLDLARVVVGSVSWTYRRPLVAGDRVHGIRTVMSDEQKTTRSGGVLRLITLLTRYRDQHDHIVVEVEETIVERGVA